MPIISQETWDNLPKEEKVKIIESYNSFDEAPDNLNNWVKAELEAIFGKKNLQSNIKTWADVAIYKPELWDDINKLNKEIAICQSVNNKLYKKLVAAIQIQKLIELGYGGNITEEEWKLSSSYTPETMVWSIVYEYTAESKEPEFRVAGNWAQVDPIAFHTKEQAEEFMSYEENLELLKDFYKP